MASNLRVDTILPSTGTSLGIGTASGTTTITGTLNAASATITGNLGVGGVLTYEDVTNIDSVGVITARSGIKLGATGANTLISGNATGIGIGTDNPQKQLEVHGNADTCLRVVSSAGGVASLQLGDTADNIKGAITFKSNDNSLRIRGHNNDDRIIINSNGIVTKPNQPSFHATKTNGDAPANSYVVFNNVNHNNGSHYNASDGKFTAPVTGVYYFSVWHYTGSTSAISFRINGTQYGAYSWDGQGGFPTWVCPMTAGQYAQIFTVNPYGFRGTADYHNGFNGFLIG